MQRFCKEVITWKSLRHPTVLPLLGVIMTGNRFAMVSEWMTNGNINQFVSTHRNVNRFDLVSSPSKLLSHSILITDAMISVAERCCEGIDPYAPPGNDPWGP